MAKFFMIIVLLISTQFALAKTIVVSDFDETIKMYGSSTTWAKVKKALYSNKVYRGMPTLLQVLDTYTDRQYVLTGSPSIIRRSMWRSQTDMSDQMLTKVQRNNKIMVEFNGSASIVRGD